MVAIVDNNLSEAAAHVLVIGVSSYPHLSDGDATTQAGTQSRLSQLSSAARSASLVAGFVLQAGRVAGLPLGSLRVLFSPAPDEALDPDVLAQLPGAVTDCAATRANLEQEFIAFRDASNARRDNVALVYVAGHGVQVTKQGAVLLLEDFAGPGQLQSLYGAVDMRSLHAGMRHDGAAKNQFWFVDTCRQKSVQAKYFESQVGALSLDELPGDVETSALFLAATTGSEAYATPGGQSLFSEALLECLETGNGASGPTEPGGKWSLRCMALGTHLGKRVKELAAQHGAEQLVDVTGRLADTVFHEFETPPPVQLQLTLLPKDVQGTSTASLSLNGTEPPITGLSQWPLQLEVPPGLYLLRVNRPSAPEFTPLFQAKPSHCTMSFEVPS